MKELLVVIQLVRRGGVELAAINFAKNLDKEKFRVSFLLLNPYEEQDEELLCELKEQDFNIIYAPENIGGYAAKYKYLCSVFKNNHFDIVHSHVILTSGLVLAAARKYGVPVRAAHSHTTKWNREENIKYKLYKAAMRFLINKNVTLKLACSTASGEWLYGKKAYQKDGIFIANGVDTDKFSYNSDERRRIRDEFSLGDSFVVGHVGSIYSIKNQVFLIGVFAELLKSRPDARLVLAGEKFDIEPVEKKAAELGVTDKIIFTGSRSDIFAFYSAFDVMCFPSLHEAFPVALIEAQAAKLPCLISDRVTKEVKVNANIEYMPLEEVPEKWAQKLIELSASPRQDVDSTRLIGEFDIKAVAKNLGELFLR